MALKAAVIRAMAGAGCTADQIAAAAEADEARQAESIAHKREQNRIRQQNQRARNAASRVTERDAPHPPALDKENPPAPPKEINPTPLTPQTSLQNAGVNDLDRLSQRLCDAADGKMQPQSALVVGPILEMIAQGVDLETDILPAIKATAQRLNHAVKLTYYLGAIRDAYNRRIEAGQGLAQPKPSNVIVGQWEQHLSPEQQRVKWGKTLNMARGPAHWKTWLWGPPPGREGCRIPPDMLEPRDLRIDWMEEKAPAA